MFLREGASFADDFYRILEAWQNRTFGLKFLLLFGVSLGCHGCCWARGGSLQGPASTLDRLQLILHTADVSLCDLAPVYFLALPLQHTNPAGLPVFLPDWTTLAEPCCFLPLHMLFHFYWKTILLAASRTLPDLPGCHCLWKALPGQLRQDEVVLAQVPIVPRLVYYTMELQ
ncbi:unnamed protein product [Rangifer tarandus platyrhynchus]|uniref:Uncharacterized protein n=2 Tax=Rangifer tarandus platyrhynchus TaxID=3082113 RepID=A0AC59YJ31_RANTA|nr:unnamed protein product [Rangifer tarandus platyrhynchus]